MFFTLSMTNNTYLNFQALLGVQNCSPLISTPNTKIFHGDYFSAPKISPINWHFVVLPASDVSAVVKLLEFWFLRSRLMLPHNHKTILSRYYRLGQNREN